jgi:hypothetical protein
MIRIDVHPTWENLIHMTQMIPTPFHVRHSYASYGRSSYMAILSPWLNRVGRTLLFPRKRAPNIILSTLVDRSTGLPPSFSPNTTIEAVIKAKHLLMAGYISLVGSYLQHVIITFNTCSRGPIHRFLTDTGGGYNLGGADFPQHSPCPSQPTILHFPPKGSVRSPIKQSTITNWTKEVNKP